LITTVLNNPKTKIIYNKNNQLGQIKAKY